jgi:hypothetical protein
MGKDQIKCNSNAVHFIRGIYKINKFIYYCYLMIYLWQFILKMSMFPNEPKFGRKHMVGSV